MASVLRIVALAAVHIKLESYGAVVALGWKGVGRLSKLVAVGARNLGIDLAIASAGS